MEFRLTYEGPLLSETNRDGSVRRSRAEHKHAIRKVLHHQLKRWWEVSPYLRPRDDSYLHGSRKLGRPGPQQAIDQVSARFTKFGYSFVPLVTHELDLNCSIEILYLRLGTPGDLFNRAGDIDNRLKTLFDALTMPQAIEQVGPSTLPDEGEKPFFCLLEDDSVITKLSVDSDVLLQPVSNPPNENDCRLIIAVNIRPRRVTSENIGFA